MSTVKQQQQQQQQLTLTLLSHTQSLEDSRWHELFVEMPRLLALLSHTCMLYSHACPSPTVPLLQDSRWHELFVEMCRQRVADEAAAAAVAPAPDPFSKLGRAPNRPADLPVY